MGAQDVGLDQPGDGVADIREQVLQEPWTRLVKRSSGGIRYRLTESVSTRTSTPASSTPMVPETIRPIQRLASVTLRVSIATIFQMKARLDEVLIER